MQLNCKEFVTPHDLLLNLSSSRNIYFRGYETQFHGIHNLIFLLNNHREEVDTLRTVTLNAAYQSSSTLAPHLSISASSDFGLVTAHLPSGSRLGLIDHTISIKAGQAQVSARLDSLSVKLLDTSRLMVAELPNRPIRDDETLILDGGMPMISAYFQSMRLADPAATIFRATLPDTPAEINLTSIPHSGSASLAQYNGYVEGHACGSISYRLQEGLATTRHDANGYDITISASSPVIQGIRVQGDHLSVHLVGRIDSIVVDGHEIMNTMIAEFLARPWYEQGAFGILAMFFVALITAIAKEVINRLTSMLFDWHETEK